MVRGIVVCTNGDLTLILDNELQAKTHPRLQAARNRPTGRNFWESMP
jgi:hypothetical protein